MAAVLVRFPQLRVRDKFSSFIHPGDTFMWANRNEDREKNETF
jgi:hypothetical protein